MIEKDTAGWAKARSKRLQFSGFVEELGPDESPAMAMVRRAKTKVGLSKVFGGLTDPEIEALVYDLDFWARREQVPPDVFSTCFIMAGRGFGKTWAARGGSIKKAGGENDRRAVGPTAADVRDTMIRVRRDSGALAALVHAGL
jgi:hypothetical protein